MEEFFKLFGKISLFVVLVIVVNSLIGDISFRVQYRVPVVTEKTDNIISFLRGNAMFLFRGIINNIGA